MMTQPIQFTEAAINHIQHMLEKTPSSVGFRISIKKTGCSGFAYVPEVIEHIHDQDIHFIAHDKIPVYIDSSAMPILENSLVDFVADETHGLKQKRLIFINQKEAGRCGCGESFTL